MSTRTTLPKSPWADILDQRAMAAAREQMHHSAIDSGHHLYGLTLADSFESPARKFMRLVPLDSKMVFDVVQASQPRTAPQFMHFEPLTAAAARMWHIGTLMAEERQGKYPRLEGAQIIQEDFIVGILLSGSEPVEEVLKAQWISPSEVFHELGYKLPSSVLDLMVNA